MLRFKISGFGRSPVVPGLFARGGLLPGPHPCIAVGDTSVQISDLPWLADLHVAFTDDPALATVRVQLSDSADAADFVVIDDADTPRPGLRGQSGDAAGRDLRNASGGAPVIYLSPDGPADYRIFVRSKTFTARDAAALVVGAGSGHRGCMPPRSESFAFSMRSSTH